MKYSTHIHYCDKSPAVVLLGSLGSWCSRLGSGGDALVRGCSNLSLTAKIICTFICYISKV